MSKNGYIKLWREVIDSQVWADPNLWRTFVCCLLLANHKEGWVKVEGLAEPVKVERGQFITGRYAFHKAMYPVKRKSDPNPKTCERWLKTLQTMQILTIKTSNKYSLVSIVNWEDEQCEMSSKMSHTCPADVQQMSTNKNDKNDKNIKKKDTPNGVSKEKFGEFQNVLLTGDEYKKLVELYGKEEAKARVERLSLYIESKGVKYSSHYATIRSWAKKDEEQRSNNGRRKRVYQDGEEYIAEYEARQQRTPEGL